MEIFKSEQSATDALHSKFNVFDGSEIQQADEVGQLQICAVSIYLLTLVQMITSDLQVTNRFDSNIELFFFKDHFLIGRSEFRSTTRLLHRTSVSNTGLRHLGTRK